MRHAIATALVLGSLGCSSGAKTRAVQSPLGNCVQLFPAAAQAVGTAIVTFAIGGEAPLR
jgi:hypothetical protein